VEAALQRVLPNGAESDRLHQAMRYAVLGGGKRIRAVLVYATGELLGAPMAALHAPACAVECIHAYSLVHDDLPAMDDDDLRRGRPACHRAYDEATAILVGDGLQALAFHLLAADTQPPLAAGVRLQMIEVLAAAAGSHGMVGGQALDLEAVGRRLRPPQLDRIHRCKTGALIRASVHLGALVAGHDSGATLQHLLTYAECIGLAFQLRDDILDVEGDTDTLGKPQGSDRAQRKATYPELLGLDGSKRVLTELQQQALDNLQTLPGDASTLRALAAYVIERSH